MAKFVTLIDLRGDSKDPWELPKGSVGEETIFPGECVETWVRFPGELYLPKTSVIALSLVFDEIVE